MSHLCVLLIICSSGIFESFQWWDRVEFRSSVGFATYCRRRGGRWLSSKGIRRAKWKPPTARRTAIRASCSRVRGRIAKQSMRVSTSFTIFVLLQYMLDLYSSSWPRVKLRFSSWSFTPSARCNSRRPYPSAKSWRGNARRVVSIPHSES